MLKIIWLMTCGWSRSISVNHPALKVLLTSGFPKKRKEYADGEGGYLGSIARNILNKPYNDEELAFAVRRTLDGES